MHANHEKHEAFIRGVVKDLHIDEVVYVEENSYDGGYEVRVGTLDFFVDYETLEEGDKETLLKYLAPYAS